MIILKFVILAVVFIYFVSVLGQFVDERHVSAYPCSSIVSMGHPNSSNHTHLHLLRRCLPLPNLLRLGFHYLKHARGIGVDCNVCCGLFAKSPVAVITNDSGVAAYRGSIAHHLPIPLRHLNDNEPLEIQPHGNFHCMDHQLTTVVVLANSSEFYHLINRRHHHPHLHLHHHLRSLAHTSHTSAAIPVIRYLLSSKV